MLKLINPILSPELLYILRAMGHRHDLGIVDANFPCDSNVSRITRLDGITAPNVLDAVLSVLPIERNEPYTVCRMIVDGRADEELPIFEQFRNIVMNREGKGIELSALKPIDFKDRARKAFALIVTGERRLYGNIIVRKGVIPPVSVPEDSGQFIQV